jgi:hypothetical protein
MAMTMKAAPRMLSLEAVMPDPRTSSSSRLFDQRRRKWSQAVRPSDPDHQPRIAESETAGVVVAACR